MEENLVAFADVLHPLPSPQTRVLRDRADEAVVVQLVSLIGRSRNGLDTAWSVNFLLTLSR